MIRILNFVKCENAPVQYKFRGSNTDGSFTTAVSNSLLGP